MRVLWASAKVVSIIGDESDSASSPSPASTRLLLMRVQAMGAGCLDAVPATAWDRHVCIAVGIPLALDLVKQAWSLAYEVRKW
jgi:hypothetical protein